MVRDGLLYVLTHRSSHGTLIDEVLQQMAKDPRASIEILNFQMAKFQRQMSLNGSGDIAV
jgi:hypothetical protein